MRFAGAEDLQREARRRVVQRINYTLVMHSYLIRGRRRDACALPGQNASMSSLHITNQQVVHT